MRATRTRVPTYERTRQVFAIALLSLVPWATGCGECSLASPCGAFAELDLDRFTLVTDVPDLDFTEVSTGQTYDYWEFRRTAGSGGLEVLGSGGTFEVDDLSSEQRAALSASLPLGCFGPRCDHHFITLQGTDITLWPLAGSDVLALLGPLETPAEAVLAALWAGYSLHGDDKRLSGVATDGSGFLLLARRTNYCNPFEIRRVLLFMAPNGTITEQASEVLERDADGCVVF